ncbi:MAG: glycoside hydrolase family 19 protein [Chryseobacterium sp.]|jgi:predicted chitinase|uniref:glycoside hydrolase family 19 protein n=1 Tax=Chryseobacterium sp. TaxID=1871047 RepID=UPI002834340A|nr:glycoside hydrolase family 19 protein [Chryseobacterium sp.]MDR2238213.1 glycoside hydrolase family 19 protein [Chryseobacterium sp.]
MTGNIIGHQNPLTGTTYHYEVTPSGLLSCLKGHYEWYLYKKQKNGTWKDITGTPKTGVKVSYRFGEPALGIEFQMKVYENQQGILPGMPATRQLTGTLTLVPTGSKVSKIEKVILFNRGSKNVNKAGYRDTLIAQAHCIAMFNKEIEFHLWEDDAPGHGHDPIVNKNNFHPRTYKARVNPKGIAEVPIPLMADERILRKMADAFTMKGDQDEGASHEYYVTASYSGKIQGASQANVQVNNPDHKTDQPPSLLKPQPQKSTPKFPIGPGKAPKQPDPTGNIIEALFVDSTGKELSQVAVGDKVYVRIYSKNMVGKHVQYVIWEYDAASHDEIYRSSVFKIPGDLCDTLPPFHITESAFKKGISFLPQDPDAKSQNYFIEIISKDLAAQSQKFGLTSEGLLEVEKVRSATGVEKMQKSQNLKNNECRNCKKSITLSEFTKIYPDVRKLFTSGKNNLSSTTIQQFINALNETLIEFKIDTCIKKAFFLAQITKETGYFSRIDENLYYTSEQALHTYWKKDSHPNLYSIPKLYFRDPEKLGNYVYRNIAENGNELSGDGYKFRGRGLIQITRKKGYRRFGKYVSKDLISNPDLLLNDLDLMVRSAGWFWKYGVLLKDGSEKDINEVARQGDFKEVTRLVHGTTLDLVAKTEILNKIKLILETDRCKSSIAIPSNVSNADIQFHIMASTGEINYKIQNEKREVSEYFYHDKTGKIHTLGKYKLNKIKNIYGDLYKDRIKGNNVYLIDIRSLKNYKNGPIKFTLDINTNRYYMNDVSLAALLGAMLDCSYEDYTFNGFSNERGESIGGSKSHKNGMNGDLRYLRKDKSGRKVHLNLDDEKGDPCGWKGMDENRQNNFNDALYKYGWKGILSWKYNGKILNHAIKFEDHHDHLHVQTFTPKLKQL